MNNREIKVSVKDIPEVIEQLQQAEDKINNLQSKIDMAIEYIKIQQKVFKDYDIAIKNQLNNLLDFLRKEDWIMNEIWKDIPEYEGLYQVSNLGNVKNINYRNTKKERKIIL